jgi:hypothetical protein
MTISREATPLALELNGARVRYVQDFQPNEARELALTPEEEAFAIEKALAVAKARKYQMAYDAWYAAKTMRPEFPAQLSAEQWLTLFKRRADYHVQHEAKPRPEFIIDDSNRQQIWLLCLYFAHDARFETEYGLKLGKGLMLRGNVGCGKSTILSMFSSNSRQSFAMVPCRDVSDAYEETGKKAIKHLYNMLDSVNALHTWGHNQVGALFDDLGTENFSAQHMGNYCNPMADILSNRHDKSHTLPIGATHLTTNLMWAEIKERYQDRVESRIRAMFNDIKFSSHARDWRRD